jgi:putative hydrolase of the HAD superfamily
LIKGVIFDLDNTLLDFMRMKRSAVEAAVDAMIDSGLKVPKAVMIERIFKAYDDEGIEDQQIFNKVLQAEYGQVDYRILAAGILGYRKAKEGNFRLYPHARITLTALVKMGLRLGIVSDAPRLSVWLRLVGLGLDTYFDCVVTFDDTGHKKPSPAPFQLALKTLNLQPGETFMIGDWAERDVVGAKTLGMKTVFARYGDDFGTQVSGADYEVNDIIELIDIIKRENNGQRGLFD